MAKGETNAGDPHLIMGTILLRKLTVNHTEGPKGILILPRKIGTLDPYSLMVIWGPRSSFSWVNSDLGFPFSHNTDHKSVLFFYYFGS